MSILINTLTSKQKKVYSAIETYIKSKGIPPTVREIGELVGEKTPGAVQGILNRLEQKGVIKRQVGMARSVQLISEDNTLYANPVYVPEIKKVSRRNVDDLLNIYNINSYTPLPPIIASPAENCFLICCPDNSLFESGIKHDDLLLILMDAKLKDGDIVLILYDNHALLRYYYENVEQENITLKADTNLLGKEIFSRNEVRIIGKLKGRYTKY